MLNDSALTMFHGKCLFSHYLPQRNLFFQIRDSQSGFLVKNLDKQLIFYYLCTEIKTKPHDTRKTIRQRTI